MALKPLRSTVKAPFAGCVKLVKALFMELAKPFNAAPSKKFWTSLGLLASALFRVGESTLRVPSVPAEMPKSLSVETWWWCRLPA